MITVGLCLHIGAAPFTFLHCRGGTGKSENLEFSISISTDYGFPYYL